MNQMNVSVSAESNESSFRLATADASLLNTPPLISASLWALVAPAMFDRQ